MKLSIISVSNDVYLACVRLFLRAETSTGHLEDFAFFKDSPTDKRVTPTEVESWIMECKEDVLENFFGYCQACDEEMPSDEDMAAAFNADKPVMPNQSEINASPMVEVIKENIAAEAAKAVIVEEKPVEAAKKTRAKPAPKVVEPVAVNPIITNAQAEVAASVKPVEVVPEVEVDLTEPELAPVIEKPVVITFVHGNREQTMLIYPLVTEVYSAWKSDNAYIAKLKPLLSKLGGKDMFASKDSAEMLLGFQQQVKALAASIKA